MHYAVFYPDTRVVFTIDETDYVMDGNDRVRIPFNDPSIIGKMFVGTIDENEHPLTEFQKQQKTTLTIVLDHDVVDVGSMISATAEVRDQDGNLAPINDSYFVPIVRNTDNWTAKLLEVAFNNGEATSQFRINEPGIYTIRMDLIRPLPMSELATPPELIVKESD